MAYTAAAHMARRAGAARARALRAAPRAIFTRASLWRTRALAAHQSNARVSRSAAWLHHILARAPAAVRLIWQQWRNRQYNQRRVARKKNSVYVMKARNGGVTGGNRVSW